MWLAWLVCALWFLTDEWIWFLFKRCHRDNVKLSKAFCWCILVSFSLHVYDAWAKNYDFLNKVFNFGLLWSLIYRQLWCKLVDMVIGKLYKPLCSTDAMWVLSSIFSRFQLYDDISDKIGTAQVTGLIVETTCCAGIGILCLSIFSFCELCLSNQDSNCEFDYLSFESCPN